MAKEKEFKAKGWKSNKILSKLIEDAPSHNEIADYINSPAFTEKDYIDVMSGMYKDLNPHERWGYGNRREIKGALAKSPHNKTATNDKAVDFLYDVLDLKRNWNKANPKNEVDIKDQVDVLNGHLRDSNISSKKIHQLVSDPKFMLEDRYSSNTIPPNAVLKNDKLKPEHLYKYLASHPSHIDEIVSHDKSDSRLEDLIFDNPQHLKNVSNSNIEHYLHKHTVRKEGQEPRLDISGKRAKTIVEHSHDKLYDDSLFKTLNSMDPEDKKSFIDKKLGIAGGKPADLASWRTNDEQTNRESEGWNDWTNGEEYGDRFAQRIAKSPHLSDDQADHIKRHGDFNVKYNLYHNKQVDPKHGAEMFKMWHDNDENKGYSSEQLQDAYKEKKDDIYSIDDIDQDLINEDDLLDNVDESTRESYDFSNWVDDNEDDLVKEMELDDDDNEKIDEKLRDDYGDWTGENPNHDAVLHGLHQKLVDHMDNEGLDSIHIDEAEGHLGVPRKEWQGNTIGHSDGTIDKDSLEEYMKDNNPEEIDYANHDDFSIHEHPEHDERYTEIADAHKLKKLRNDPYHLYDDNYENYNDSDKYREAYVEAMKEAKEEAAKEHYGELYASSHQDDRFIPEHLHAHIPNIEDIKRNRKKAIGEPSDFLDKHIPKRSYEHSYGDEQHLHEFVKDYADANGGTVDIGRMHKLMPNQGETWKKIFGSKGKITSDEIQGKIDGLNKTPYAVSYGKWDSNQMQNVNSRDQIIFRLDHTDESLKPLQEDPEVYNTFKKVQEVSKRSGHPTKDNTIAWARVDTTDPDHWMIDEVQSDFGKTVTQYLKENNEEGKSGHVQKISDYHKNWRESLINRVINEAKKHGASKVSTHSPESKASHTGAEKAHSVYQDSYKKVPRKMGFKPSPAQTLPVTEKTREGVFNKNDTNPKELMENHTDAWNHHKSWAYAYMETAGKFRDPAMASDVDTNAFQDKQAAIAEGLMNMHTNLADQHGARAKAYGQTHDNVSVFPIVPSGSSMLEEASSHMANGTHEKHAADKGLETPPVDFSKQDYHEGHTYHLKPSMMKNMLDMAEDLVKFELIWNGTTNKDIRDRAKYNIDLIKHLFGYEADLSKWQSRRRMFADDIKKAIKSPSKHIGLGRLKQIKQDHSIGAGGQEYSEEEINDSINERSNAHADKMVRDAGRQEKAMAQRAQDEAAGIGGASPADFPMFNKPKMNPNSSSGIRQIADKYAASKGLKLNHNIDHEDVNTERAGRIAQAYHDAKHSPSHPDTQKAYGALVQETSDQFKHILGTGLKVSKMKEGQENPYKTSKDLFHDIKNNNHMWYYPTEQGYGSGESVGDHPLLQPTEHMHEGKPMVANDVFRIVHDYFGHAKEGNGFGPKGEEHAWKHHMQMYGPDAQKALTSETRGQNSWVNFGPHGESNRANPANTKYADQKATLLPDWAMEHGTKSVYSKLGKSENDLKKSPTVSETYASSPGIEYDTNNLRAGKYKGAFGENKVWEKTSEYPEEVYNQDNHDEYSEDTADSQHYFEHKTPIEHAFKKSERPYPAHLTHFKRGDKVKLSHGVSDPKTGKTVINDKLHTVHGVAKQGQHAHWVVPEGEHSSKGFYHRTDRMHYADDTKKTEYFQINISIQDEENDLDKSEFYSPSKEGEKHPTKPYVAKAHPDGQMMWHHDDATAQKNDSIINDPKQRQRLLQKMPTSTHKRGMEAIMNKVAQDPNRHFIPSRDGGREKMRARHIKSLMLSPESTKIDLDANNMLSISLPRHGYSGGFTTWNYNLTPAKVVKNEKNGLERSKQGRDFEAHERIQLRGNLRKYRRSIGSVEKAQHRADLDDSGDRSIRDRVSGKHLQKLQILMKGAARRLFPFNPDQSVDSHEEENISRWQHASPNENADEPQNLQDYREDIPRMEGAARVRALNKLSRRAQFRPSSKGDGKREFLLHRGMSEDEHQATMSETGKHIMHGVRSSWTPSYGTANEFVRNYNKGKSHKPVSAWIHEDRIASIPKQYGKVLMNPLGDEVGKVRGYNQYADEFETIIDAHHSKLHDESGKKNFSNRTNPSSLDEAISDREGLNSYYVKQQIQSHRSKKSEVDITKGAMKKLAPFKPEYGNAEHEAIEEWTGFGDADSSARDEVPAMPQNAKIRGLHKLGKHTEVRKHPKTGERMFLLHRGMSGDEYANSHSYSNHLMDHSVYDKGTKTSWTPHVDAALGFAKDHKETSMDRKGRVVSAWIPESEIHSIPNQVLIPDINNQFRNEHEIIVNHMTPHPHANKELVNRKRFPHKYLNTKINMKGHAENERKSTKKPEDMLNDQVAREDRAMKYRDKKGIGKKESDMETLTKADLSSRIKAGLAGMAIAGAVGLQSGPVDIGQETAVAPIEQKVKQETAVAPIEQKVKQMAAKPAVKPNVEKNRILSSIMDVESSGGRDTNHDRTPQNSMHRGDRAYGAYGLMPITIRETIKKHPDLMEKHGNIIPLHGSDLHNYMDKHPELEKEVASRHYDRLARIFGHNPAKISYAWLNGITGTKRDLQEKKDIDSHWHVQKIKNAYEKHRKQPAK